jgi:spermidine/putrescine transport system permease protein
MVKYNRLELTKKICARLFIGLVLALLYLPLVWVIVFSFSDGINMRVFGDFTFRFYTQLFTGPNSGDIFSALGYTMLIATVAATIATILGTLAAIGLHTMRNKRIKRVYSDATQVPMINADMVTTIALVLLFVSLRSLFGLRGDISLFALIIAHVTFCTPYVILSIMPRFANMDNNLYEAALDLGATPRQAIKKVLLPQLAPGIVIGFIMSFTLSIDDFIISYFHIEDFETLSTYIHSQMHGRAASLPPEMRALSSLIFLIVLGVLVGISVKTTKKKKEVKK